MRRFAIYYRVSTDRQDFESQKYVVDKWLSDLPEDRKPKVEPLIFQDEGISGRTMNRPGLQALLAAAYSKKIDTIIVYRLDRLSRLPVERMAVRRVPIPPPGQPAVCPPLGTRRGWYAAPAMVTSMESASV